MRIFPRRCRYQVPVYCRSTLCLELFVRTSKRFLATGTPAVPTLGVLVFHFLSHKLCILQRQMRCSSSLLQGNSIIMLLFSAVLTPTKVASLAVGRITARRSFLGGETVLNHSRRRYSRSLSLQMKLQTAIVGLPNVGKSTLFNALTQTQGAQAANYPFCTIEPNVG